MVNYVTGLRLACPVPIRANPCQSMPIWCQSGANFSLRHKFFNLPIWANPIQSGANWPIWCQSANPVPIGQSEANPVAIGQSGANQPIRCQFANSKAILHWNSILWHACQSKCQWKSRWPMHSNWKWIGTALASSLANPGYSEDNCASNLGTSPLYGMVPSLLGGWI